MLHDHSDDVEEAIGRYGARLAEAGLPDIPFHSKDLLHGNEASQCGEQWGSLTYAGCPPRFAPCINAVADSIAISG